MRALLVLACFAHHAHTRGVDESAGDKRHAIAALLLAVNPSLSPTQKRVGGAVRTTSPELTLRDQLRVLSRRAVLCGAGGGAACIASTPAASAIESLIVDPNKFKKADVGQLEEIPPKAKQAYLQYLPQLQLAGDFYFFDLQPLVEQPGRYDQITALTTAGTAGSATAVSRLEREFVTPMKILSLAFPPDLGGEEMQTHLGVFQTSMVKLSRLARQGSTLGNTAGATSQEIKEIIAVYDVGRVALNKYFATVNEATGTSRLVQIPSKANEKSYPRSKKLYTQLLKEAAICRNRGGEALAGLWGGLMVYGTVPGVNPCGDSALAYYSQGL